MQIKLESVPQKSSNIVFRKIEDEYILVPMLASSAEVEHIFSLNKVGADVWERINGEKTAGEIVDELIREYEETQDRIKDDVLSFLSDIAEAKIIEVIDEGR